MGFSNPGSTCLRHQNDKQLPGVCSFCLRERLSRLSSENNSYKTSNSSFSSSLSSSSPPSARHETHQRRNVPGAAAPAPMGFVVHQGGGSCNNSVRNGNGKGDVSSSGLKKSKSVAWAPRISRGLNGAGKEEKVKEEKSGKKGLWKKLVHSTSKKTKGVLMHSMTLKERSHDANTYRRV